MDTSPTETYPICHTLSLHSALPIYLTGPTEEPALHRALNTGPGEIFTLRDEGDASAHHENQEERVNDCPMVAGENHRPFLGDVRSEEHKSELQSLMRISYAVFCLKHKNKANNKYCKQ